MMIEHTQPTYKKAHLLLCEHTRHTYKKAHLLLSEHTQHAYKKAHLLLCEHTQHAYKKAHLLLSEHTQHSYKKAHLLLGVLTSSFCSIWFRIWLLVCINCKCICILCTHKRILVFRWDQTLYGPKQWIGIN